jgi:hypothetical protein
MDALRPNSMVMPSLIRTEWRAWVAIGAFMAIALLCGCALFRAWADGAVYAPRLYWGWSWISYQSHPIGFAVVCSFHAGGLIVSAGVAFASILALFSERRFFQRRASRPPLDDGIRGSPNARA